MKKITRLLVSSALAFNAAAAPLFQAGMIPAAANESEPAPREISPVNLALNKPASASSNEGTAGRSPDAAVDGNTSTRWASAVGLDGSGIDETWFQIDLQSEQEICQVVLNWESRPNKCKIQVSNDGENWTDAGDVVDNGYLQSGGNKKINTVSFETVTARYVRMQGIVRRNAEGANGRTGYSLYEMEVYGPAWSAQQYVNAAAGRMSVPKTARTSFTLPIKDAEYGVSISWLSDNPAMSVDENGHVSVTRTDTDQIANLTAVLSREEAMAEKSFTLSIPAASENLYELSPVPHSIVYGEEALNLKNGVVLTLDDSVSESAKTRLNQALEKAGIPVLETADENTVTISAALKGNAENPAVAQLEKNHAASLAVLEKAESYVLAADGADKTIAIEGADEAGLLYGLYTLNDLIVNSDGNLSELVIEDYPDIQFRGFIEGFYGSWSHSNRLSLLEYCGQYKMNTYIYGPKNDPYHYGQWKDPYPDDKLAELAELVETGKKSGVNVVWAAHVGGRTDLSDTDIEALEAKFDQLYSVGFRQFALFFDDSSTNNTRLVEYVNKIQHEYVDAKGDVKPLIFCPQYYRKSGANISYLQNLAKFDERVQIMWTGDNVVSPIEQQAVDWITNLIQRDVFIWWNWPVNDLGRANLMHLGPTEAAENGIQHISGVTSNPMNQAQASKVALYSIADYVWNTQDYDSDSSWKRGIHSVITDDEAASEAFAIFAQNCSAAPMSFSSADESVYMKPAIEALKTALINEEDPTAAADELNGYLQELDDAAALLQGYKGTNNLSGEIGPWLDTARKTAEAGQYVLAMLDVFDNLCDENGNPDSEAINGAMQTIEMARSLLKSAGGAKQAARKTLYPAIEDLIHILDARIYAALQTSYPVRSYSSFTSDFSLAMDGLEETAVSLGKAYPGSYVGLNLGTAEEVHAVRIAMNEANGNQKGSFKKSVLETSLDGQSWTEHGVYDTPVVEADLQGESARFVRLRALEVFEDEVTGENLTNISLKEISVNKNQDWQIEGPAAFEISRTENRLNLTPEQNAALEPGQCALIRFDVLKTFQQITCSDESMRSLTLEASRDGKTWSPVSWNQLAGFEATIVRVSNKTDAPVTLQPFTIQFAGRVDCTASLSDTITNDKSSGIYSGNAKNLTDGDENSTLWLKRGTTGNPRYVQLALPDMIPVEQLEVLYKGDNNNGGHVDVSTDGENWQTVFEFSKPGSLRQTIDLGGVTAKYLRYYINTGEWSQIAEMRVNKNVRENAATMTGDLNPLENLSDGNLYTAASSSNAGSLEIDCISHPNPKVLHLVQGGNASLKAEVLVNGEWKEAGNTDQTVAAIDLSDAGSAEKLRLSWAESVSIREVWLEGTLETHTSAYKTLLEMALAYASAVEHAELEHVNTIVLKSFEDAKTQAASVLADPNASDAEVQSAWSALVKTIQMLGFTSDKSALSALIVQAQAIADNPVCDPNLPQWQAFTEALEHAKEVLNRDTALDASIEEARAALEEAINNLPLEDLDTTLLSWLLESVKDADEAQYTPASWLAFVSARDAASAVLASPQSQSEIDQACSALHEAWLNLRYVPDEALLARLAGIQAELENLNVLALSSDQQSAREVWLNETKAMLENPNLEAGDALAQAEKGEALLASLKTERTQTGSAQSTLSASSVKTSSATMTGALSGAALLSGGLLGLLGKKRSKKNHK